jgi:hypothetical protein
VITLVVHLSKLFLCPPDEINLLPPGSANGPQQQARH